LREHLAMVQHGEQLVQHHASLPTNATCEHLTPGPQSF